VTHRIGWKSFAAGFVGAGAIVLALALWFIGQSDRRAIFWPPKTFYDDRDVRPGSGYIAAAGSLIGEDMDGSTFLNIECRREERECRINELHQWKSPRGVSLYNDAFPITSWANETVVAEGAPPPGACNRVRLVIIRSTETVQYHRIPEADANKARCKASAKKAFVWSVGDQPLD